MTKYLYIFNFSKQINKAAMLYISSILAVVIGIAVSALNAHYLSPSELGDVKYVINIVTFISSLLLFGFFNSGSRLLALTDNLLEKKKINGVLIYILIASVVLTMISMILIYFLHIEWLNVSVAPLFLIVIPVSGAPLFLNYINTTFQGDNRILGISLMRVLPPLIYLIIGSIVFTNMDASSKLVLILQNSVIIIVGLFLISNTKPILKNLSDTIKTIKKENREYGIHVYTGSVLAVSLGYLGGITLGLFNDNNIDVAYYTLALSVSTPLQLLPSIIGTSYYKKFAKQHNINRNIFIGTIIISLFSFLAFAIIIGPVVNLLYPIEYSIVSKYAIILAMGTTAHGFGDLFNRFLGAHGKGKELRNSAFLSGATLVFGNILFVYWWGIYGAILTKVLSSFLYLITMNYYYYIYTKR